MIKSTILSLLFCAVIFSTYADEGYVIKGTLKGDYTGYIYLFYNKVKDSALVKDNSFEFTGKVDKPVHAWMHLKPPASVNWVYLENSTIFLNAECKVTMQQNEFINMMRFNEIIGSYSQTLYESYGEFYSDNKLKENFSQLLYQEFKRICQENPKHPVAGTLLSGHVTHPKITYDEFVELSSLIDTAAMHSYDIKQLFTGMRSMKNYTIAMPFFQFSLPGYNEKTISLDAYKGKFVLIDFWASWCAPCRKKHPAMKGLQKKYQGKNFAIVGISIDKDENDWRKAVEKDEITWDNALDLDRKVSTEIGVQVIPAVYLLDGTGKILATDVSVEEIDKLLSELLN